METIEHCMSAVAGLPVSVGYARPERIVIGITTPTSRPKWPKLATPTAPCSDGVMMFAIEKRAACAGVPAVMPGFLRSRTFAPHVLTRPNEKSPRPSTCDEFRVM